MNDALSPETALGDALSCAERHIRNGEWEEAIPCCAVAAGGDEAVVVHAVELLAVIAWHHGDLPRAAQLFQSVVDHPEAGPDVAEALGVIHSQLGRLQDALFYGKLAMVRPPDRRLLDLLGPSFPGFAEAFLTIRERPLVAKAKAAATAGDHETAAILYKQHLSQEADDPEALSGLADALIATGKAQAALGALRSLRLLAPEDASVVSRLGTSLTLIGNHAAARATHGFAVAMTPDDLTAHAARLRSLQFDPTAASSFAAAAADLRAQLPEAAPAKPRRSTDGPLRVGYMCRGLGRDDLDLVASVTAGHSRAVALFGYGSGSLDQARNVPLRGPLRNWRDLDDVDPYTAARIITGDDLDALVIANGLADPEYLPLAALRPAPVQVAWLNVPRGLDLPGIDAHLAERLPHGVKAFRPVRRERPQRGDGPFAFGADADLAAINPEVAACWGRLLMAVPDSVLVLRDHDFTTPENSRHLIDLLGNFGIAHRIEIVSEPNRSRFLASVDTVLTPFPICPAETAAEALAAGSPVVALSGGEAAALLDGAGLSPTMVAADIADYVAKAQALVTAATTFRHEPTGPAFDPAGLGAAIEACIIDMARA